jgi:hypothetical protein
MGIITLTKQALGVEGAGQADVSLSEWVIVRRSSLIDAVVAQVLDYFYQPVGGSTIHESQARWIASEALLLALQADFSPKSIQSNGVK